MSIPQPESSAAIDCRDAVVRAGFDGELIAAAFAGALGRVGQAAGGGAAGCALAATDDDRLAVAIHARTFDGLRGCRQTHRTTHLVAMALAGDGAVDGLYLRDLVGGTGRQQRSGSEWGEDTDHRGISRARMPQA
ncbi:hypothetical protein XFF6994_500050 [Xanthomonas citri pv. fuscans]|nr:hypothetical protein XFF6994_500050 [Xanthomonas citri pv. fuscans]